MGSCIGVITRTGLLNLVYDSWSTDNKRSIERVTNTKFLGVYIDECLAWTNHTDIIANKIAKNIGKIRKMAYLLPSNILSNLYYTMIYPYYTYCYVQPFGLP